MLGDRAAWLRLCLRSDQIRASITSSDIGNKNKCIKNRLLWLLIKLHLMPETQGRMSKRDGADLFTSSLADMERPAEKFISSANSVAKKMEERLDITISLIDISICNLVMGPFLEKLLVKTQRQA